ncbi:putative carboxypeptidase Y inhibitor [Triangularia verruculosa]|uniref:Carboxypeptidase Y inhibitor n=1 Tax=Triangularia verruculosa TaxID=2587418 RepID=A0AAN6XKC3_9PEZI|nr:putative carboxypeptidase Y inhibitor [Triangularia verruculosa]
MKLVRFLSHPLVFLQHFAVAKPSPLNEQHAIVSDGKAPISNTPQDVRKALLDAEIIPTVIDDFLPPLSLDARWSHSHHTRASLGNTLKPSKLDSAPKVTLARHHDHDDSNLRGDITIVVTMTDPDAPSRDDPKWSEFCHWIAVGVLVSAVEHSSVTRFSVGSSQIMEYKPPSPPEKTGKHRYVLLAFAPANGTTEKLHLSKPRGRKHWGYEVDEEGEKGEREIETKGVRQWAAENGLVPIAANFFYAQNKKQ